MNKQILRPHKSLQVLQQAWLDSLEQGQVYPSMQKDFIQKLISYEHVNRIFFIWQNSSNINASKITSKSVLNHYLKQSQLQMQALQHSHGQMLGLLLAHIEKPIYNKSLNALCIYDSSNHKSKHTPYLCTVDQIKYDDYILIKSYSGQLAGIWNHEQWAPTLYRQEQFAKASINTQLQLHFIANKIQTLKMIHKEQSHRDLLQKKSRLKQQRKFLSQSLTRTMYQSCILYNHLGEQTNLQTLWPKAPMGTGDCCAPKMLVFAAKLQLRVVALTEFWWHPHKKDHKTYPYGSPVLPCQERCMPIMPFLLKKSLEASD